MRYKTLVYTVAMDGKDIFGLKAMLDECTFKEGYTFDCWTQYDRLWFCLQVRRTDIASGKEGVGTTTPIIVEPHWTEDQIVRQAFKMILGFEEHELRETFKYRGKAIFGPHLPVKALLKGLV